MIVIVPNCSEESAMRKKFSFAATVIAAMCGMATGHVFGQQLLSSFEGNLSSSVGANWGGPGIPFSEFVSVGATEGTSALAVNHGAPWNPNYPAPLELNGGLQLAQAVASHDFLALDVTTTDLGIAGDGWSPAYRAMWVIFNSNQGGWHQSSQFDFPVAADDGGSLTYSDIVLDLNSANIKADAQAFVNSGGGEGTYFQLIIAVIGGDQGTAIKPRPGDYSPDDFVTAADYVTWRKSFGGTTLANETVSLGSVDAEDYTEWKANFGNDYSRITTIFDNIRFANAGSGSGSVPTAGIPEPSSGLLLFTAILMFVVRRIRI
jgi:hypothetical protein